MVVSLQVEPISSALTMSTPSDKYFHLFFASQEDGAQSGAAGILHLAETSPGNVPFGQQWNFCLHLPPLNH